MKAPRFAARARLAALLAILALEACSRGHADSAAQPVRGGDGDLVAYRGRFEPRFLLTGQLEAIAAENLIVPRIPNWQTTIRWLESEGAVVRKGQRLVEFDTTSFAQDFGEKLLAWEQAGSGLAKAEADRVAASADTEFQVAQRSIAVRKAEIAAAIPVEFLRGKDFQENQIALTRARTELAKAEEDRASRDVASEEAVHQARIVLDKARRELDAARQAMDGMVLKAPRDGIVVIG